MNTRVLTQIATLALLLALTGAALANDGLELPRWALGGGASDSAAGSVALQATLGQPVVGVVTSRGGDVTLGQGFWHGGSLFGGGREIYLPLVQRQSAGSVNTP